MNTRQNTKEYIKSEYFLFIVLNKSSNLSLFSFRRPQHFNSHTTSLLTVACNAIPARSKVTFRLTEGKNVNYITPRNVSLGCLCSRWSKRPQMSTILKTSYLFALRCSLIYGLKFTTIKALHFYLKIICSC